MKTFAFAGVCLPAKEHFQAHTAPPQRPCPPPAPWNVSQPLRGAAECAETELNQKATINTYKCSSFSLTIIHRCLRLSPEKLSLERDPELSQRDFFQQDVTAKP